MYSDTHFHFSHTIERTPLNGVEMLEALAARDTKFGLEIGTECNDLPHRQSDIEKAIAQMHDSKMADRARNFMYFSAGIWPDVEAIKDRWNQMDTLKKCIADAEKAGDNDILNRKIIAIGECGLDHHWNPEGVDGRCESQFDQSVYEGEAEMFQMQLELAKEMDLPIIIHSRDAFEGTYDCIKNVGWNKGIIHCYSYGVEEAKKFLELGWYISFSGGCTYTKKSKMDAMHELLNLVPEDKILCETDAPYLAPVPFRGTPCSPVLVEHTYKFIAEHRGVSPEALSETVDKNIQKLFFGR